MRIGFDGRWFFSGNPSGKVMACKLLQQLIACHPEHEYFVFLPRRELHLEFPLQAPHVKLIYTAGANGFLANCISLPWQARKLDLDVCVFFYFSGVFGKYKKIVFVNDITFLAYPGYFTWKEKLYFRPIHFLSRWAARICTLSQSEKERMVRYNYAAADRIAVVSLGVDEVFVPLSKHAQSRIQEVRAMFGLPQRFLLYVGRMNERKNILNLLKAVKALEDQNIKVVLAGKVDWKMFDLQVKIKELALQDRVLLLGQIAETDLPVLYAQATVFCYVSFAEGFGLPPLEAMASGVPVVVSDRDSLPEICGAAASYVDPQKPEDIAVAIDRLLMDPELREQKRAKGLLRAKCFTWKGSAERLLQVCCEVVR
ncbi:MAG: glycosyltransferase family 4 protein [Candidatus Aminicenantes bacterium]|nr:glycosyltransferase family 4 protein [Acidobacteriota bacterium]MCG2811115.1 glycosyltransferase family 4 protein [Candidatus Aminicenantes bacterium]